MANTTYQNGTKRIPNSDPKVKKMHFSLSLPYQDCLALPTKYVLYLEKS